MPASIPFRNTSVGCAASFDFILVQSCISNGCECAKVEGLGPEGMVHGLGWKRRLQPDTFDPVAKRGTSMFEGGGDRVLGHVCWLKL